MRGKKIKLIYKDVNESVRSFEKKVDAFCRDRVVLKMKFVSSPEIQHDHLVYIIYK